MPSSSFLALPLGPIVAFAQVPFDAARTSQPIQFKLEFVTSYTIGPGAYPIDLRGLGDAPMKEPRGTWKYLITAPFGLGGPDAYQAVQQGLADIVSALQTPYSYDGSYLSAPATVSGQVGDLVVLGGDQVTQYVCFARCEMLDVTTKAGSIMALEVPLQFAFLSDWSMA